jgi:mevalonate kinase
MLSEPNYDRFFAKLMLFGEYSIIHQSKALTVPFNKFSGKFSFKTEGENKNKASAIKSNSDLLKFAKYLTANKPASSLELQLDVETFLSDIENGLFFDSNIPRGYGVGSSGALIAAVYKRYAKNHSKLSLKNQLAYMESFFHGRSSGIDPLVSYYNKPVLIDGEDIDFVDFPNFKDNGVNGLFLIDTQGVGETAPLVNLYLHKIETGKLSPDQYIKLVNGAIDNLYSKPLNGSFLHSLKNISLWQMTNLNEMIPREMLKHWENGLLSGDFYIKLCGSGGGGYLIAFVRNLSVFKSYCGKHQLTYTKIYF